MPKFFALIEDCTPLTLVDSSSVRVGDAQPNDVGKATVARNSRCIGEAVVELGMGAKELTPMSGGLSSMATVARLEDFARLAAAAVSEPSMYLIEACGDFA